MRSPYPLPDNGGNSGTGYSMALSPCSSEAHSSLSCVRESHQLPFSVPPFQRLLALFKAFSGLYLCM
jgi:hypothetical protein